MTSDPPPASSASDPTRRDTAAFTLALLESRRSVRRFEPRAVSDDCLERLLRAATSAPSAGNRQPWRFTVVRSEAKRQALAEAVRARVGELYEIVRRGHHADDVGDYWHAFHRPLRTASLVIVPQYREQSDLVGQLLASGGATAADLDSVRARGVESHATSAAVMALLLQAHAEGLGSCWMTGPLVAEAEVRTLLDIPSPWRLLALVAVGYPAEQPPRPRRKPLSSVIELVEDVAADDPAPAGMDARR